jgi:copper homeostasis protein
MSIVTIGPEPARLEQEALLQVVVLHPRDAAAATAGGADRLLLLRSPEEGGRSVEPAAVSAILRETDLPVRVVLRLDDGLGLTGASFARLTGLAREYGDLGAEGVSFGFLDPHLDVDRDSCLALATELQMPWTFSPAFDATLAPDRAWRSVRALPWLDSVTTAGSSRGVADGADELVARCAADPGVARFVLVAGGLVPDQVPWLVRAGIRQFGLGASVRPDRSWTKAYVDQGHVRAWRMLLDDALARAMGVPVD